MLGARPRGSTGRVALTSEARADVAGACALEHPDLDALRGQARVHTEGIKNRAKLRPLGIPVIMDRCPPGHGCVTRWNPSGRPGSNPARMGFRPSRSCQGRGRRDLHDVQRPPGQARVGAGTRTWPRRSTESITTGLLAAIGPFPGQGDDPGLVEGRACFEPGKGFAPDRGGNSPGAV